MPIVCLCLTYVSSNLSSVISWQYICSQLIFAQSYLSFTLKISILFNGCFHKRLVTELNNWIEKYIFHLLFIWWIFDVLFPCCILVFTPNIFFQLPTWLSAQEITLNFDWFYSTKFHRINSIWKTLQLWFEEKNLSSYFFTFSLDSTMVCQSVVKQIELLETFSYLHLFLDIKLDTLMKLWCFFVR